MKLLRMDIQHKLNEEENLPQIVEEPTIDYTNIEEGILEFTITLKQAVDYIKVGQEFNIDLPYPSGIILYFTIIEVNRLTLKLKCEINSYSIIFLLL